LESINVVGSIGDQALVDHLSKSDLVFGDIELARLLAASAQANFYENDEVIYKEGDVGEYLCILLNGRVRLLKNSEPIYYVKAGSVFGEFPIIDPNLRLTVTAVADSPDKVLIARVTRDSFLELADKNPILWRRLCRTLVERLMHKS
jgi:CRP-like cAMP-binding protein